MAGQTPARGHTLHATGEVVTGLSNTHRGHTETHLSGAGQLDQGDVVVDGEAIVFGVLEDLSVKSYCTNQHPSPQYQPASNDFILVSIVCSLLVVFYLADPHGLSVLSVGRAVMLSQDDTVRSPETDLSCQYTAVSQK